MGVVGTTQYTADLDRVANIGCEGKQKCQAPAQRGTKQLCVCVARVAQDHPPRTHYPHTQSKLGRKNA